MRSHWVLLIVNLAVLSAGSLALVIGGGAALGVAIAVKRFTGASLGTCPLLCIFLAVSGPLFYAGLHVVKPDRMIRRLMDR
jgi:hypothetical protein